MPLASRLEIISQLLKHIRRQPGPSDSPSERLGAYLHQAWQLIAPDVEAFEIFTDQANVIH